LGLRKPMRVFVCLTTARHRAYRPNRKLGTWIAISCHVRLFTGTSTTLIRSCIKITETVSVFVKVCIKAASLIRCRQIRTDFLPSKLYSHFHLHLYCFYCCCFAIWSWRVNPQKNSSVTWSCVLLSFEYQTIITGCIYSPAQQVQHLHGYESWFNTTLKTQPNQQQLWKNWPVKKLKVVCKSQEVYSNGCQSVSLHGKRGKHIQYPGNV